MMDGAVIGQEGLTPLHCLALCPRATVETVQALVKVNADALRTKDKDGNFP